MSDKSNSKPPALDLGKHHKSDFESIAYKIVSPGLPPLSDKNRTAVRQSKSIEAQQKRLISERTQSTTPTEPSRSPREGLGKSLPRLRRARVPPPLDVTNHGSWRYGSAMRSAPLRGHRMVARPYPVPQMVYMPPAVPYYVPPVAPRFHQVNIHKGHYVVSQQPASPDEAEPENENDVCEKSNETSFDDDVESCAIEDGAVASPPVHDKEPPVSLVSGELRLGTEIYTYQLPLHQEHKDSKDQWLRLCGTIFDDYIARTEYS
ncbi:hypothetical protein OGAPHI_006153 [Ogataea philodendri]|uniref:Uncharacterized protein n=1 Tax=Ogataea philodendri TaxID=1378263 RepID=A0A9P8NYU4_9ASCO|nr:uncharacterized protein OGAPHI_006153 [Ogataea philodendri]KAH3661974.1 hypothetical protein OGAPHI_006153 [Ogataea philodendri]